jgi:hypothetical protein
MSVAPVSSNLAGLTPSAQGQSRTQQFKQQFDQLSQDLQSGNLAAAQQALPNLPQPGEASGSQSSKETQNDVQNRLAHRVDTGDGGQSPALPPVTLPIEFQPMPVSLSVSA